MSTAVTSLAPPSLPPRADVNRLDQFFAALESVEPFAVNRVSDPSQMECDVETIHAEEFQRLTETATKACRTGRGAGLLLLGGAGTGKSHLLARLSRWANHSERAVLVFLHNIQVDPNDVGRYLLKCCVSKLAEDRLDRLEDTPLYRLVGTALKNAFKASGFKSLTAENQQEVFKGLARRLGGDECVFDIIYKFFFYVAKTKTTKDKKSRAAHAAAASLAVRWLKGDLLDAEEARSLGLPVGGPSAVQLKEDQVEAVLLTIARLSRECGRPFILCIDQVDNMREDQLTALCRAVHSLICHADVEHHILVILSGVQATMEKYIANENIPESVADRFDHRRPVSIRRIKRLEMKQLLESRLYSFLKSFEDVPEVQAKLKGDSLFPLGADWFARLEPDAVEFRPRDVLTWADDQWRDIRAELGRIGGEQWLRDWPKNGGNHRKIEPPTPEQIVAAVAEKVGQKLEEAVNARRLHLGTLPADAGNLLGLTRQLLHQCLNRPEQYTLAKIDPPAKGKVDLIVRETRPTDRKSIANHVQFIVTGSKTTAALRLRQLLDSPGADRRILVTDEERSPLPLGPKGEEYYQSLKKAPGFEHVKLSFEDYARMDAMMTVIGEARSNDLEIEPVTGFILPVSEQQVVACYHEHNRYAEHTLLRPFLTEQPPPPPPPPALPPRDHFRQFITAQLAFMTGTSAQELTKSFFAHFHPQEDASACFPRARDILVEMHGEGLIILKPWNNDFFIMIGSLAG